MRLCPASALNRSADAAALADWLSSAWDYMWEPTALLHGENCKSALLAPHVKMRCTLLCCSGAACADSGCLNPDASSASVLALILAQPGHLRLGIWGSTQVLTACAAWRRAMGNYPYPSTYILNGGGVLPA